MRPLCELQHDGEEDAIGCHHCGLRVGALKGLYVCQAPPRAQVEVQLGLDARPAAAPRSGPRARVTVHQELVQQLLRRRPVVNAPVSLGKVEGAEQLQCPHVAIKDGEARGWQPDGAQLLGWQLLAAHRPQALVRYADCEGIRLHHPGRLVPQPEPCICQQCGIFKVGRALQGVPQRRAAQLLKGPAVSGP